MKVGVQITCEVCGQMKQPRGRSAPIGASFIVTTTAPVTMRFRMWEVCGPEKPKRISGIQSVIGEQNRYDLTDSQTSTEGNPFHRPALCVAPGDARERWSWDIVD